LDETKRDWLRLREALGEAATRTADLLHRVRNPAAPGTGAWTAAETATHLAAGLEADHAAAVGQIPPDLSPEVLSRALGVTRSTDVAGVNVAMLETNRERDLGQLSARIENTAGAFLEDTADAAGDEPVMWLGGVKVPVAAVVGHWIGESLLHGMDIATGSGLAWAIEPACAELTFTRFLVPLIDAFDPRAFVDQDRAKGTKARVEIRVRDAEPVQFVLEDGALRVERPPTTRASCYVAADAASNFLLTWGRIDPLRAAARGRIRVWGRKPWKALQLARALRMP